MSQLDLAGVADVSAKHISFLETGRSQPSRDMILRLASTLAVPLRDQNALLVAAGFTAAFREPEADAFGPEVQRALHCMMKQQEPYPLVVFDGSYDLVMRNTATQRLLHAMLGERAESERNVLRLLFDPTLLRPYVVQWETVARSLLSRLQRESLSRRHDDGLRSLLSGLMRYEGVPPQWRTPDFESPSEPTLCVRFNHAGVQLGFLVTLTVFQAPQNVSLEELQIESYFPLDDATEQVCRALAAADP